MVANTSPFSTWKENFRIKADKRAIKVGIRDYFQSFLPILSWIITYLPKWVINDFIAGLTVSLVSIPQALAYASLAQVPAQYGLTACFMPLFFYTLTGTSREMSVGPTAIVALSTGKIVLELAHHGYDAIEVASALAFWCGVIITALGVTRLGKILDLIPDPVIIGFINGAALNIASTQLPKLLGLTVSTNQSTLMIVVDVFRNIGKTWILDFAIGLSSIVFLLIIKYGVRYGRKKYDNLKYLGFAANGLAVLLFTLVVYAVKSRNQGAQIHIVGSIPNDLKIAVPNLDPRILSLASGEMVTLILVIVLEHVALAKGLSKKVGYVSNSSQELVALGGGNLLNGFFHGIPVTGSLSRTSIQEQAGAQSPLANIVAGAVILIALKFLTFLFYYLPSATLGAMVILAVLNLLEDRHMYKYLLLCCPSDLVIFVAAILVTIFVSTEMGILVSIILAVLKLVYYLTRPFLTISSGQDHISFPTDKRYPSVLNQDHGVMIFQPLTSVVFLNAESLSDRILDYSLLNCKPPVKPVTERKIWSMDLAEKGKKLRKDKGLTAQDEEDLFPLRGVVFDFLHVQFLDYTAIKVLIDLRSALQHIYTPPDNDPANAKLPFHFVHIHPHILPQLVHGGLLDIDEDIKSKSTKKEDPVVDENPDDLMVEHNGFTVRSTHLHHTVDNALHGLFNHHSNESNSLNRNANSYIV